MLADLLQSGIEDINNLEKPYIFAEVGRMAAEESSLMNTFWRAVKAANIQGFFIFIFKFYDHCTFFDRHNHNPK